MTEDQEPNLAEPLLNELGWELVEEALSAAADLNIRQMRTEIGATLLDFGVHTPGSLGAGLALAEICAAGLIEIEMQMQPLDGTQWPHIVVFTDMVFEACMLSQFAGWKVDENGYRAIASGPMRAARGAEGIFQAAVYFESARRAAGVLEASDLPTDSTLKSMAKECGIDPRGLAICVAPTTSIAGNIQVVSRSIETAIHKLYELDFDLSRVVSATGVAPLPPVAADGLDAIGRTNDAILYGGSVTVFVQGDDESIREIGPKVPSSASPDAGRPFADIFKAAGGDFYEIDPLLFSPAEIVFHNVDTGNAFRFGRRDEAVLLKSFGL